MTKAELLASAEALEWAMTEGAHEYYTGQFDDVWARIDQLRTQAATIEEANLKVYGYAPGNYYIQCSECKHDVLGCDKRAIMCLDCARKRAQAAEMKEDEPVAWCQVSDFPLARNMLHVELSKLNYYGKRGVPLYTRPDPRVKELEDALRDLLADTQHSEHYCGDEDCPVVMARAALKEKP